MTIKEIEQELNIPRATVRYYEKQNLIKPVRNDNSYRDYSNEDVSVLRKIVIFRKLGMSVSDIEQLLNGNRPLSEIVNENIIQLQEQIDTLNGALKVCKQMKSNGDELDKFDEMYYWNVIHQEEQAGSKFMDIAADILKYEKKVALEQFGLADYNGDFLYSKKETILRAIGLCLFIGIFSYFLNGKQVSGFLEGFFMPFSWLIIATVFGLPIHFLEKKKPDLANKIRKIGTNLCVVLVVLLLVLAIILN